MLSFEEFKEKIKDNKYKEGKSRCIVCGKIPAYWEIGDARYYCSACEEHANLNKLYEEYKVGLIKIT